VFTPVELKNGEELLKEEEIKFEELCVWDCCKE
jgi:hypothetical protein